MEINWDFEKEPCVIDEALIFNAIISQGPKGDAGKLFKEQGVCYEEVKHLRLDFLGNVLFTLEVAKPFNKNTPTKIKILHIRRGPVQEFHTEFEAYEASGVGRECAEHNGGEAFVESPRSFVAH